MIRGRVQPILPRPKRIVVRQRAPKRPLLVAQAPRRAAVGVQLTDGSDQFEILDRHVRNGSPWVLLANMDVPEARAWFQLEDCFPLGYVERKLYRESVARRESRL